MSARSSSSVDTAPPSPDVTTLVAYMLKHPAAESLPVWVPLYVAPRDSAASSTTETDFAAAISLISSMSAG